MTLTNQNCICEEMKSRVKSGNSCYHQLQNLLSSSLQSRNMYIKIYRTITLLTVHMGLTLGPLHCGCYKSKVLRKIFRPKSEEVIGKERRMHNEKFHGLYSIPDNNGVIKSRMMRLVGHVAHMRGSTGAYRVFMGKSEGKNHLEDLSIDGRKILK